MARGASYRIGLIGRIAARRVWRWRERRQHARHERAASRYADARTDPGTTAHAYTHPAADNR